MPIQCYCVPVLLVPSIVAASIVVGATAADGQSAVTGSASPHGIVKVKHPMIIAVGYVVVVAAVVLTLVWSIQRRLMYFPAGGVPTPRDVGLSGVESVTFETVGPTSICREWCTSASRSERQWP